MITNNRTIRYKIPKWNKNEADFSEKNLSRRNESTDASTADKD